MKNNISRTFCIGDIHGGYKAFIQVLEKVSFDYDNDKLIALGDATDGWPETAEVIEELIKIKKLVYLKGNHDEWTERFLRDALKTGPTSENHLWYSQGGKETYDSYFNKSEEMLNVHLEFLTNALEYYIDEDNRVFVHAGFNPRVAMDKQYHMDVGQTKKGENATFYWDRSFWGYMIEQRNFEKVGVIWGQYKEIYIGHTPTINYNDDKPINIGNVWNMDTGATYSGKLSIMNIDTKEITQSEPLYLLYPEHMGRNREYLAKK
tara:strand:+ start:9276 stop:10064 length:789 start_codon:yes stop_codon:yes gene_type:complete